MAAERRRAGTETEMITEYNDAKQKKTRSFFLIKTFLKKKKHRTKKMLFYGFCYYLQFKGIKEFFNTLECLFMLYTSCKTLHSVCQLHYR